MPNNNNRINFQVGYNVDQASVNAVKKSLQDLQNIKFKDFNGPKQDLELIRRVAGQVLSALTKAFNVNLNSLNTQQFNAYLKESKLSIDSIYNSFSKAGAQGQVAFSRMANEVLTTNMQLKLTNSLISQMGETMANTVKWGIASSIMNNFTNSVKLAFSYVKALDSSLNDIRIVTKQSSDLMANFAVQANNSAQALGRSTMDYTKAALTFYQQGLDEATVKARTESVLKAQNITGAGDEMADYLTAVWNGYKVANEEAELYVDKLAAVADSSASNMSLLAIAMSKVASSANLLGVPVDSLNAQIATIVATTRQAPLSVGNALKTIYSRINDIATGADDAEISLGNYSAKMALVGISVLDANGRLRDTGDVIDEIGGKWETLSHEQQIYLARTMAGQRQYNNLLALFENWGKYSDLVNVSMEAQGATALKNAIYMESLSAKMEQLGAAGEKVKAALIDEEDLKGLVEFGTGAVNLFANLILSIGGGKGALLAFGSIFTQVFSGTIAKELNNTITNIQNIRNNKALLDKDVELTKKFGTSKGYQLSVIDQMVLAKRAAQDYYKFMDAAQINEYNQIVKQIGFRQDEVTLLKEKIDKANLYNLILEKTANKTGNELLDQLDLSVEKSQNLSDTLNTIKGSGLKQVTDYDTFAQITNQVIESKNAIGEGFLDNLFNLFENLSQTLAEKFAEGLSAIRGAKNEFSRFLLLARLFNNESSQRNNFALEQQENEESLKKALAALDLVIQKQLDYLQNIMQFSKVKTFVNMAAGLGQFASGLNNIVNLTKIWKNESLSAGEKLIQTFTNLGMTIPMMVNGFTQAKKGFDLIILQGKIALVAQLMGTKASFKAMVAKQMLAGMDKEAAIAAVQHAMAEQGLSVALKQVAADAWAAIAPFAPFIAIAAAAGLAIYAMYKEWNRLADAAKKAALVAQKTKETYDDLKSTYEDLKSSLEDYNSAQEAIAEMTKGTQEWRDAIRESNDAVLDLIQAYPELASEVENVNGQLVISAQAQQEAILKAAAAVDIARLANMSAEGASRDASLRAEARNASRFAGLISYSGDFIQATTDQVMNLVEAYSTATDRSVLALSEQTGMSELLVSSILREVDNMDLLAAQLQANTEALKLNYQTIVSEKFQDNAFYKGLDDLGKQVALTIGASLLLRLQNEYYQEALEQTQAGININSGADNNNVQAILEAINKARGTNWALDSNAVQGTDTNRTFHFLNDEGQPVVLNKEQVAHILAAQKASLEILSSLDKTKLVLKDINNISNKTFSTALKDFIGNLGFGNLTKAQLELLDASAPLMQAFFKEHGAELGEDFEESFIQAQRAALKDWDLLGKDSLRPVQETIANFFKGKDFSLQTAQNISTALDSAFKQVGNEGIESLIKLFDDSTLNIDLITKAISSADISTPEGLQALTEELQKIGDGSFAASEEWLSFVNQVSQTHFENPLDTIFERQLNVGKITKGLNKYSIISDDDYNTLLQINPQIDAMFDRVAGGYLLVESKGSLMELLTGGTNGYFLAANQFDQIKESATNLAESFGKDFLAGLLDQSTIPNTIKKSIESINAQLNSELLWSALGFNEDYINALALKYGSLLSEITERQRRGLDTTLQKALLEALDLELREFLTSASTAPDLIQGISDSLRDAGALGLETISLLNHALYSGDLGEDLQLAIERYNEALQKVSDIEMENLGFDVDLYEVYVDLLKENNLLLEKNLYLARLLAKTNMRVSEGTQLLIDNWDEWSQALLSFRESGDVGYLALSWSSLREALANLFNSDVLSIDMLGPNFIANNLDKILAVKNGVLGAYELLSTLMDQLLLIQAYGVSDFSLLDQDIQDAYQKIQEINNDATILIGAVVSGEDEVLEAFNKIALGAHWTSEEAQAAFSEMGYDVEVEAKDPKTHETSLMTQYYVPPRYRTTTFPWDLGPMGRGEMIIPYLQSGGYYESVPGPGKKETYEPGQYAIKTVTKNGKGSGGNISRRTANSPSNTSSRKPSGGGSKGSSPKAATPKSVSLVNSKTKAPLATKATQFDVAQRELLKTYDKLRSDVYHDINIALDQQEAKLDKIIDQEKKLIPRDRLDNLKLQNSLIEKQNKLLDKKSKIADSEIGRLQKLLANLNAGVIYNADGTIANYNKVLDDAEQRFADATKKYNEDVDKAADEYDDKIRKINARLADEQLNDQAALNQQKGIFDAAEEYYNNYIRQYNALTAEQQEAAKDELERQKQVYESAKDAYNDYLDNYKKIVANRNEAAKAEEEEAKKLLLKQKKIAQQTLDQAKEARDKLNENVKEYEETLLLQNKIIELQNENLEKIYDNLIAISKIKVDMSIESGDFERDWLDFEKKVIKKLSSDDFLGSAKASIKDLMSYINSNQVALTAKQITDIRKLIADMLRGGESSIYGTNLAQAKLDLEKYMNQQMSDLLSIQDYIDDIKDNYLDALDNAKDKMDDQIDQYERVNDLIDHNVKLTLLLYGDTAYGTMNKYYNLQKQYNEREMQSLRMQQKYWQDLMKNEAEHSPAWEAMKKNLDSVTDQLNKKLEDMIDNLAKQWLNRVDGIIARLNQSMTGGRGLNYLDEQWDQINNFDNNFLDTFESNMGIQLVTDLYQQAIDGLSGSPANQQKINKLMNEQLKILREKDNLTQYDIDRAKAALEVLKARMALEDARYNKTKMRLRRDSQGNYTYQYVADELKLGDLQSALADAQANLYNMDKEHYTQNLNTLYDAYKDYIDKMRVLTEEYNSTQDAEERKRIQARIDLLKESTSKLMQGLTEDNRYAIQYLNQSYFDGMGVDTSGLSAELQMEIMTNNIPQMRSNIQDLANTIVGQGGILNATNDAMKQISDATVEYDKNVKQFLTDAGTSLSTVTNVTDKTGEALDKNIQSAKELITTNQELINQCNAQVDAIQKLMNWLDQYMNKVINVEQLVGNLRNSYNTIQGLNGSGLTADLLAVVGNNLDTTTGMNFTGNPQTDAAAVKQQIDTLMAQYEKFLKQMSIAAFETGGYTGTWGDAEGRLAFLHQGELVLNQLDTSNILSAVQLVRNMASAINGFASGEINSLMNGATGLLSGISNTEQLDQNVHIEANFPNVTQHTEIEQAFENLVNMASMRASKYRD